MVEISVAPEMGTVMEGSLKDKEISFQFFSFYQEVLGDREFTFAPFIFMASVHPPPPHPKFPMWQ